MGLFKRKKRVEEVDTRSNLEKTFEEKGQKLGKKTGKQIRNLKKQNRN